MGECGGEEGLEVGCLGVWVEGVAVEDVVVLELGEVVGFVGGGLGGG